MRLLGTSIAQPRTNGDQDLCTEECVWAIRFWAQWYHYARKGLRPLYVVIPGLNVI